MSNHRYGHGDHPSQQINVRELQERLHLERLEILARRRPSVRRAAPTRPTRLSLRPRAYRHLAAVALLLALLLGTLGAVAAVTTWRDDSRTQGWIRSCSSCHGRTGVLQGAVP